MPYVIACLLFLYTKIEVFFHCDVHVFELRVLGCRGHGTCCVYAIRVFRSGSKSLSYASTVAIYYGQDYRR